METILLIDDNEEITNLTRIYLEDSGYKVHIANNGKEGINLLIEETGINLVVVDFAMPGMTGPEVCEVIRKELKLTSLPIIMLTGMKTIDDKLIGYRTGIDDYILKPFEPMELVLRVESLFKRIKSYKGEPS
jgi:DNA-binding response OmpR family regulator